LWGFGPWSGLKRTHQGSFAGFLPLVHLTAARRFHKVHYMKLLTKCLFFEDYDQGHFAGFLPWSGLKRTHQGQFCGVFALVMFIP
jgi:hypothetical protein